MNDGFWCKYCGKQKAWDDRDYDFGLYLAEIASFEALEPEYVTPYLICKQCADDAREALAEIDKAIGRKEDV
jgi:hypothetical protein